MILACFDERVILSLNHFVACLRDAANTLIKFFDEVIAVAKKYE